MAAKDRIRGKKPKQGALIKSQDPPDYNKSPPIFSLEKLQPGNYCLSCLDQEHKAAFADAIFRRKSLTWNEVLRAHKHGLGTEKIPRGQISAPTDGVTEDVEDFLAFRYHGLNPMIGYRQRNVFYVLWFDHNFSLYDHG